MVSAGWSNRATIATVRTGEPHDRPDTVIDTDPDTLTRILGMDRERTKAINDGRLTITGDNQASKRLFEAVALRS